MPRQKTSIYLSSTYQDLKAYRQKVLERFQREPFRDYFEVTGMEGYGAEDKLAWDKCIEDVRNCRIYFLISGEKYGSVFDNPQLNPEGYSFTHKEYLTAREDQDKQIFVFRYVAPEEEADAGRKASWWSGLFRKGRDRNAGGETNPRWQQFKSEAHDRLAPTFSNPAELVERIDEVILRIAIRNNPVSDPHLHVCCDRAPQMATISQVRLEGQYFKVFVIQGLLDDLGEDLARRIQMFNLNPHDDIADWLSLDTLAGGDYENQIVLLLARAYVKLFREQFDDGSVDKFFQAVRKEGRPVGLLLNVYPEMLDTPQIAFLQRFFEDCHAVSNKPGADAASPLYLFLNVVEEGQPEESAKKLARLQKGLPQGKAYFHILPRLDTVRRPHILEWLRNFFDDQGSIQEAFDQHFIRLGNGPYRMQEVQPMLKAFMKKRPDIADTRPV